jgi:hypothetical protein
MFHGEESGCRGRDEAVGEGSCAGGYGAAWLPWSGRTGAGGELDHDRGRDAGADDAGHHPIPSRVQVATTSTSLRGRLAQRVSRRCGLAAGTRAVIGGGCCCVLLGLERPHDLLGGRSVATLPPGSEAAVEVLTHLKLGQRRAVGGHRIVGQAERERGEVLLRVAGPKVGRGPFALALIAASTSVLERPGAVGTLGD